MKYMLPLVAFAVAVCAASGVVVMPVAQQTALEALFNATGGPAGAWGSCGNGWLTGSACSWLGVSCDKEGNAVSLMLNDCGLSGTLPLQLNALTKLQSLFLSVNSLSGALPAWTGLTSLVTLSLDNNTLTGTLPASWSAFTKLQALSIGSNQLTGSFPSSYSKLVKLTQLQANNNQLTGQLPDSWSALANLQTIDVHGNQLSGTLPSSWQNLTQLQMLNAAHNQITGHLPDSWSSNGMQNVVIHLEYNAFNVNITNLQWQDLAHELYLSHNQLFGGLPQLLLLSNTLRLLDLSYNKLSGELPTQVQSYQLKQLYLNNNQLSGSLNNTIQYAYFLQVLDLSSNQFSGPLPLDWEYVEQDCWSTDLCSIDLSNNDLTGSIPEAWCQKRGVMNLENNCLSDVAIPCTSSDSAQGTFEVGPQRKC